MVLFRQICEDIEPNEFINCFIVNRDNTLIFKNKNLGKIDSLSIHNEGLKDIKPTIILKLLSLIKFLNRNYISGIYHDTVLRYWFFSYRQDDKYSARHLVREIYIWDDPKDTLSPVLNYYFKIFDRKERMLLVGYKDVPYKQFPEQETPFSSR
ncbi:hypothetical protein GCM10028819_52820 [Spirosoma humi]